MESSYYASCLRSIALTIEKSGTAIETANTGRPWPGDIEQERREFAAAIAAMAAKFPEIQAWAAGIVA
ncbi:MAG: hypothetical protein JW751_28475 [Polyangiaceae bacterium]|nr:hypothetical protein [Polyangiaceae bacterium]